MAKEFFFAILACYHEIRKAFRCVTWRIRHAILFFAYTNLVLLNVRHEPVEFLAYLALQPGVPF
jgi:hypothetical protein